ncbi:MAG: hypothetical protein ACREQ5_05785 [Candidatus Dormibacteria bacterium]
MNIDGAQAVALGFSAIALVAAGLGVVMQNAALHYADLGEVPDSQGAFLGGELGGPYETGKSFYRDLRAHYRRSASGLSKVANLILLVSVVSGIVASWTGLFAVAAGAGALWIVCAGYFIRFALTRRGQVRGREARLEAHRLEYNSKSRDGIAAKMGKEYAKAAFREIASFERVHW